MRREGVVFFCAHISLSSPHDLNVFTTTPRFARAACLECYKSQKDWNRLFSLDTASVNIAETSTNAKERQMAGDYMLNLHTYDHVS